MAVASTIFFVTLIVNCCYRRDPLRLTLNPLHPCVDCPNPRLGGGLDSRYSRLVLACALVICFVRLDVNLLVLC
jgi:hypothetical protein